MKGFNLPTAPAAPALPDFEGMGPVRPGMAGETVAALLPGVLPSMGAWARRTIEALPDGLRSCSGYRDVEVDATGRVTWHHPHSNSAERICAFLWLAGVLRDKSFEECARHYAEGMLDPATGIYRGPEEDGVGMVWYWRDSGLYMTNYTMRVPSAFLELARATGDRRFREAALSSGEQLLRSQHPCGILRAGWAPARPASGPALTPALLERWLPPDRINSRVGYAVEAFSVLYEETGDSRYGEALARLAHAFARLQNDDGSFPSDICTDRIGAVNAVPKGHFMGYILDGFASALRRHPDLDDLRTVAVRLADYLTRMIRQTGGSFYGNPYLPPDGLPPENLVGWLDNGLEGAHGLAEMACATGNPHYREAACRLTLHGLLGVTHLPQLPDIHGLFPLKPLRSPAIADNPEAPSRSVGSGYHHFKLLLALKALEITP